MSDDPLLCIGGSLHGRRISVSPASRFVEVCGTDDIETYVRRRLARVVVDLGSDPPSSFVQNAYVLHLEADPRSAMQCDHLLLPSDWHEVPHSRRAMVRKEEATDDR